MSEAPVRVLYIAGSGRSGSTLLGNILGEVEGFFFAGEVRFLWDRGLVENRLCGCGQHVRECELWHPVIKDVLGEIDPARGGELVRLQGASTRARHLPLIIASRGGRDLMAGRLGSYPAVLGRLYRAVADATGARVIVDSSKLPTYGWLLGRTPSVDLYVVHLVRDPRAAAFSWLRKKALPDRATPGYMQSQGPAKSGLLWTLWNAAAEAMWRADQRRYLQLRYEDFVAAPRPALGRILAMVGEGDRRLPFAGEATVVLAGNHSVAGNPDRMKGGEVVLRADEEWTGAMRKRDRAVVTALAAPLLLRYGYPISTGSGRT